MPLYNVLVKFHLEYCVLLWSYMFRWEHMGRRAGGIENESFLCKTERLLLACLSNRKTEKPVLSSKSVRDVFFMEWDEKYMLAIYTRT